jgi:phosphoribosylcarboxyaminoimidazole (NCAIR) mutase
LLAARILAVGDPELRDALLEHQRNLAERSRAKDEAIQTEIVPPE